MTNINALLKRKTSLSEDVDLLNEIYSELLENHLKKLKAGSSPDEILIAMQKGLEDNLRPSLTISHLNEKQLGYLDRKLSSMPKKLSHKNSQALLKNLAISKEEIYGEVSKEGSVTKQREAISDQANQIEWLFLNLISALRVNISDHIAGKKRK
ncbi:hypothetical protein [Piscirickettsia litoralis]|uniref:Uncharacterized protein n=1 Tax=Piscirickettsia litoralis TaxID=1891921 RepID=A0ABX3A8H3_9GAMM|nr:hypothetical protein [Piscirickettsia litoralis]ODN43865.1 hypothetical protein BGC07_14435 [Piscirickettsia litoralis]